MHHHVLRKDRSRRRSAMTGDELSYLAEVARSSGPVRTFSDSGAENMMTHAALSFEIMRVTPVHIAAHPHILMRCVLLGESG